MEREWSRTVSSWRALIICQQHPCFKSQEVVFECYLKSFFKFVKLCLGSRCYMSKLLQRCSRSQLTCFSKRCMKLAKKVPHAAPFVSSVGSRTAFPSSCTSPELYHSSPLRKRLIHLVTLSFKTALKCFSEKSSLHPPWATKSAIW